MLKPLIIIPTYNEEGNIDNILTSVREHCPAAHVLVVDDNSPDGTGHKAELRSQSDPQIHVLHREGKMGLGRAYVEGFRYALREKYDCVFEMDADFSHDPKYIPDFLKAIEGADLVIGSRYISGVNVINWPMSRLLLSYFANMWARLVTGLPVRDTTGGYKCIRRKLLESLNLDKIRSDGYSFQIEINYLAWKMGFRIREIPIVFYDRQVGASKMSSKIIKEAMTLLWKMRVVSIFKPIRRAKPDG